MYPLLHVGLTTRKFRAAEYASFENATLRGPFIPGPYEASEDFTMREQS